MRDPQPLQGQQVKNAITEPALRFETTDVDVEVLVDGSWVFGELCEWRLYATHGWVGHVRYSLGPGDRRIAVFPAEEIRELAG